jgi:predicted transcriptional regulator
MTLKEVIELLDASVLYLDPSDENKNVSTVEASDLMSDILASVNVPDLLLTGLTNPQVVRTASIFGIKAVIIVKGKKVEQKIVDLAKEEGISIMSTEDDLFEASGKLYARGIRRHEE